MPVTEIVKVSSMFQRCSSKKFCAPENHTSSAIVQNIFSINHYILYGYSNMFMDNIISYLQTFTNV